MTPTPTPSLRRRVVVVGVLVVALLTVMVNVVVHLAARAHLEDNLRAVLDERAAVVRAEGARVAAEGGGAEELARALRSRGVRAVVRAPDGERFASDPDSPTLGAGLPPVDDDEVVARSIELDGIGAAEVQVRSSGVRDALRQLAWVQLLGTLVAVGLAAPLLSWAARSALLPVRALARAADRTATGALGERLQPDRPGTELGRMAAAYDAMLDQLEAGRAEAAAAERRTGVLETRWRQVLEVAGEPYVAIGADGEVRDWNRASEQLFGWSRDEALGMPAAHLLADEHHGRVPDFLSRMACTTPGEVAEPFALTAVDRDGRSFPAECTVWGVERRGGLVVHAFLRDVTERRRAEEAAALLRAVVEGTADAVITSDLDGRILTWNAGAEALLGWPVDEAVGQDLSLVVPEEEAEELEELLERLRDGERVPEVEVERLTRGGTRVPVALRLSPVHDETGDLVAVSALARDITEQRWMAETLDRTLAALQAAADEATTSEEATRRFLADAAHQLRTPMAGIRACAEALLRGAEAEDADRLLATVVRETSRAARLISSLLQIARLDQGVGLALEPVDVVSLCAEEVDRLDLLSPHLSVRLEVVGEVPPAMRLDPAALREVLSNLGDNARRHAASAVVVRVSSTGDGVQVRVEDDGPGVPLEVREQVFERFVSLDGKGGSGLGLPIARGLTRAMGGDLVYREGFELSFPSEEATPAGASSAASA